MIHKKPLILALLCLLLLAPTVVLLFWLHSPNPGQGDAMAIEIAPGANITTIAKSLATAGVLHNQLAFRLATRLKKADRALQAGFYLLPDTLSPWSLVELLRRGSRQYCQVTLPEGLMARRIASILARELEIDSCRLVELIGDSAFARELGLGSDNLEGHLFPETYRFFRRQDPRSVLTTLVRYHLQIMDRLLTDAPLSALNRRELVTLASIIQGEMRDTAEARLISSVYHNRLQAGWKLQADPTIQYLLPEGPRRLLLDDLKIDSPYNTYLYRGLPPGPVNNPGEQALAAAVNPAVSDYYFFVADGSGRHLFSRTGEEHVRARKTLDSLRRKLWKKH